ncbi:MAG: peptidase dimerization domain-containing protein, partial [Candidatus Nanopelagicales bacterium]|nr:peptidase dimerization domain-containing protein [Candidatus Nanopelagicales bacterium]
NAIHRTAELLETLTRYRAREVEIDGLTYREGLNAVAIAGGVAGNVIPDECVVTVNYRFAPDLSPAQAEEHLRQVFPDVELVVVDSAPGARPGLHLDLAREFVAATGERAAPKFGWTDVARFAAIGIPALNFGPGSPSVAHTPGEFVDVSELRRCEEVLRAWLAGGNG